VAAAACCIFFKAKREREKERERERGRERERERSCLSTFPLLKNRKSRIWQKADERQQPPLEKEEKLFQSEGSLQRQIRQTATARGKDAL
jgi:hypothetical protein